MGALWLAAEAGAQIVRPWAKEEATADSSKFPDKKWFQGGKGFNEALEIQKTTGADIVVYFANYYPSDEKGLCNWFEKRGLGHPEVDKYLRDYIKVKITFPLGKADEEALARFKVGKCPALFVAGTKGFPARVPVFNWPPSGPELLKPNEIVEGIRSRSSERYQTGGAPATTPAADGTQQ
jgi:hypothetical protein